MRIKCILLTTAVTLLYFSSCKLSTVSLDYTNAKDEVPQLGNLVFRFDKSLVNDSLLNLWDSTGYVTFEPAIPGRFRWEQPDELVFSPSQPLLPATTYKATLKSDILQYSKYSKILKSDDISFRTPNLKLENVTNSWVIVEEKTNSAVPVVDLYFNYPVNPSALKEKLQVSVGGQPTEYSLMTLSADNKISIRLMDIKMEDKDVEAKLTLAKGLVPQGGRDASPENLEAHSLIASPYALRINDISAQQEGVGGSVMVLTSQQVSPSDLSSFIKIDPQVKFTVEVQDEGFLIRSDNFDMVKSYELTIAKGLRGRIGGVLKDEYSTNIAFGQLEPSISFSNPKAVYLSLQGEKNVEVQITNVAKVKITVSKIYENNILAAQKNGYEPEESATGRSEQDPLEGENADNPAVDYTSGDVIYQQDVETRSLPASGSSRVFHFDLQDKLNDVKGIYHIQIQSTQDYWVKDSRFISVSDIGLVAKEGKDNILVFANSIKNAGGIPNVNVFAYGANNQLLGKGSTNADGVAQIAYARNDLAGNRPAMIIAKTADDFNYLPFGTTRVNTSRFDVGGKHANRAGLDAFIYPERDIYRPGEKLNFAVILRDYQWKSPGEIPIKMKFLLPNGKDMKVFRKTLNDQGSLEESLDISSSAITGSYSLEVYTSTDVLLATQVFRIEEFVPDRIKVTTQLDQAYLKPGDSTQLHIHAVNFFGPPAADRNYECEIQVKQKMFHPKRYSEFDFSLANQNSFFDKTEREGKTDDQGDATEGYAVQKIYKNMGLLQATFFATVFDETGRPVSKSTTVPIYTQDVFLGVANDGYAYYPLDQPVQFRLIALDKNEQVVNQSKAQVQVIKHEYRTVLSKSGNYFRYQSQTEDKLISSATVILSGANTAYSFVPRSPGDYELRIALAGSNNYVARSFYSYGNWGSENSSFQVNNEGQIDIALDKSSYSSSESVKALFKTPFNGRMLVTLETDKVISYQYVEVDKRSASLDLKLSEEEVPNAYITATLFKPHDISEIPLTVAHGFLNVQVENVARKIPVEIDAQKTVRSHTHQTVRVKALPNTLITLAAVDNGVLQVSDFVTPDPYNYFYAKRALEVSGFDLYPLLFPEIKSTLSSSGGDSEADMKKRVNPMPAKRFKIVSYWSGIRQANASGEATFEFDIPQFSGEIRLMAVAYRNENFGSGENKMTVADPIVLSSALPRFLSPKDSVTVPVTVTNTTDKPIQINAQIRVTGGIRAVGSAARTATLSPNSENRLVFQVVAEPVIGTGKVTIDVSGLGEKFTDETDIGIRPVAPLQKITGSGSLSAGQSATLDLSGKDFIPASQEGHLLISRSPAIELTKYLTSLIQYPYGCTEQTVSAAFPQLYYGDLADMLHTNKSLQASASSNIQEAIRKIKMRQLYNGGVTLWDDQGTENWWTTIYAAHFLLEAQKAGYEVDKSLLETMLGYIANQLKRRKTIIYYYNRNQNKKIAPKEVSYGLYVLALAGRPDVSAMNYYKSNPDLLALDSKYLLSAAYALAGDKNSFAQFLPTQFSGETSVSQSGGSFYSDIRDESVALDVLVDVDPANAQIPVMANHVTDMLKQRYWISTQELAFSFMALGKIAHEAAKSNATAEVLVNGKTIANFTDKDLRLSSQQLKSNKVEIKTSGTGRLYYFFETEGISASGEFKEEDDYLKVRKGFYDRYGREISGNSFKQNDLIIVKLTLEKSFDNEIDNVVITDMLPAGFEIENPRTKEIPGMDWIKVEDEPTAMDVRDDRINLFVDSHKAKQTYYYAVRAVSPGLYHMGPVSADAMYKSEYHSYSGGGVIKVNP